MKKEIAAGVAAPQRLPAKHLNDVSTATSVPKRANKAAKAVQQKPRQQKAPCISKRKRADDSYLHLHLDRSEQQPAKKQNVKTSDPVPVQQSARPRRSARSKATVDYCEQDNTVMLDAPVVVTGKRKVLAKSIKPLWHG